MSMLIAPVAAHRTELVMRTAVGPLVGTHDTAQGGYTIIAKYGLTALRATGNGVRLILQGPSKPGRTCALSNVTISLVSTSSTAKPYDSNTTPTAVTFRSSNSVTLASNGFEVSDEITFTIDDTRQVLIGYNVAANSGAITQYVPFAGGLIENQYQVYRKSGVAEADDTTRGTGYTLTKAFSPFLYKLECFS